MIQELGFLPYIDAAAKDDPGRHYASFGDVRITVGDVYRQSSVVAAHLHELGVRRSDRVAVMMANSPTAIATILGIARAGAVWVPVNINLVGDGLQYVLEHSEPAVLLVDRNLAPVAAGCGVAPGSFKVLVSGSLGSPEELEDIIDAGGEFRTAEVEPGETVSIMYTSGTTGRPKGVLVSHRMLRLSAEGAAILSELGDGDVLFVWEPLFHIGGAQVLLLPFLHRVSLALVDRFSASRFWAQCAAAGATQIHHLGGILQLLLKQPEGLQDRSHAVRIAWGGACRADIWRTFENRFGIKINECYGMTEASSFTTVNTEGVVGSTGCPLPWFKVEILDLEGRPVPVGQRGEIVLTGLEPDCIFRGYFRNPEATASAFCDGRFHTSDIGSFDAKGRVAFHGRLVDSLRVRGENISAWEIEHVINQHPDVEDSAVIGVEAEIGEMDIKLFVQPSVGKNLDLNALAEWARLRLSRYQLPRYFATLSEFPRTPSQRNRKHLLSKAVDDSWDRLAKD